MKRDFPGWRLRWLMVWAVRQGDPGEEQSLFTTAWMALAVLAFVVLVPAAIAALVVVALWLLLSLLN